jgi:hypothetical protein
MKKIIVSLTALLFVSALLTGCLLPLGGIAALKDEIEEWQDEISRREESLRSEPYYDYSYPDYSYHFEYSQFFENSEYIEYSEYIESSEPSFEISDDYSEPIFSVPDLSEEESIPAVQPDPIAELDTLTEVRDFINGKKEEDVFEFEFIYNGDKSKLDGLTIARISSSCVIYHSVLGNKYEVRLVEYPGDRIVDAYRSGNLKQLSAEEKSTLMAATEMVNAARKQADSDMELEILLHDMLAQKVTYYDGTVNVTDAKNPPHHLTAVGALLDGKANCQGYADGFYTLASIAGFEVGRMNVYNSDGWHILNTIKLDGKWYAVDVTFNDCMSDGDEYIPSYRLFNVGKDRMLEYFWGAEMEYYPLERQSDKNYFYYLPLGSGEYEYKKAYTDIDLMAQDIIDRWLDEKMSIQCVMYVDNVADWKKLSKAMEQTDYRGENITWTIWTYTNGRDTFYTLKLS